MLLSDAVRDYLGYIKHERGLSPTTIVTYTSWLHHFEKWLPENGYPQPDLTVFTTPLLRRYQYALGGKNLRPRTVRAAFFPLRGLGEFLIETGTLKENPVKALTMPKKDAARRLLVSTEELQALMAAVERQPNPKRVAMSRAMPSVPVYTGVRAQELIDIEVGHVSLDNRTILIASGKGAKSRLLHPPAECMAAVAEWLIMRDRKCKHNYLWALDTHRRIAYDGLRIMVEEIKCIAGLRDHENIKPHSIRHAFATRLMTNGAPSKTIQAALGHSHAQTTFTYLHLEEQQSRMMADFASLTRPTAATPTAPEAKPDNKTRTDYFQRRRQRQPTTRSR